MKNKEVFQVKSLAGVREFIYLEIGNDWQTMLKSEYDEKEAQAALSTPIVSSDAD